MALRVRSLFMAILLVVTGFLYAFASSETWQECSLRNYILGVWRIEGSLRHVRLGLPLNADANHS